MADFTITVGTTSFNPVNTPNVPKGATVVFTLSSDRPDATVTFVPPYCFNEHEITLDSQTPSKELTVLSNSRSGKHRFTAPQILSPLRMDDDADGIDPNPMTGDLDVSSNHEEEELKPGKRLTGERKQRGSATV